jgi:putative transposase
MSYTETQHHRRSVRLPAYDYTQAGAYFVTMVTHRRQCLFGEIADGRVTLNPCGEVIEDEWLRSTEIRPVIRLDAFIIMPNHVHGIVVMGDQTTVVGAHSCAPLPYRPPRSLGSFIAGFKSAAAKRINEIRGAPGLPVWQRNYYEHVIRNDEELHAIRQYITDNPLRWAEDRENPISVGEPNVGTHSRGPLLQDV